MNIEEKDSLDGEYFVQRKILDELRLDEVAQKGRWSPKPTVGERVKESMRCSAPRLKQAVLNLVPVLDWLPKYSLKENIVGDLVSGCSVGIMHLPQGMAYALLASLPPVFGLYSSLYPVIIYFIFGTSRHISMGTFAVISVMVSAVTQKLAPDSNFFINGTNATGIVNIDARDAQRVKVACSLTILAGLFQILFGLLRLGFVVTYLSEPLVRGYTTASAFQVGVSQLKFLFGISQGLFTGPISFIYTVVDVCQKLPQTKVPELVVSLVALFFLISAKEFNTYFSKKLPVPIPIELIAVVAGTVITHFCGLTSKYNINVVGQIPSGFNAPSIPDSTLFLQLISDAFSIAIVAYAINISLGKTFALQHGYKVDNNQELIALGLCNTISSFFQCFCVAAALSRSLVQETTGGKTQVAGVVSSIIVLITILKLGSLLTDLPKAVLATIVFVNLKGMFMQLFDLPMLWKTNKTDLMVWLVTFISTILLNLDLGLAVSVCFAMLTFIFRTQLSSYFILGRVSGTDLYLDIDNYKQAKEIPGIKIFRSSTTIYYTNAEMFLDALQEKSGIDVGKMLTAKKKQETKLKHEQENEKKKAKKEARKQIKAVSLSNGTLSEMNEEKVPGGLKGQSQGIGIAINLTEFSAGNKGQVNWAYQHDTTMLDYDQEWVHGDDSNTQVSRHGEEDKQRALRLGTHTIILDISTTSFVDTATVMTLKSIFKDFGEIDVDIYLAGCQACVVEQLETADFFSESIPKSRLFVTVHDAVLHILKKLGQTDFILDAACNTQL